MSATVVWSVVPVGIKYLIAEELTPFTIAFSRFVLASLALAAVARLSKTSRPVLRGNFAILMMGGLGMAGNYTLYALGLKYTTASASNIIVQNEVVALVILSHFILGERIGLMKIAGIMAAIAGILIVFWNGQSINALLNSEYLFGNAIIFLAGLSWPFYALAQKILSRRQVSNINGLAWVFGIAAIATLIPAILTYNPPKDWTLALPIWLFTVGVIATGLGYFLLARAFDRLTASTVGVVTCMLPIFTLLSARLFLGESLTTSIALGAAFVVGGIILIGRDEATAQPRD